MYIFKLGIEPGGHWRPRACEPRQRVAIVVPYRYDWIHPFYCRNTHSQHHPIETIRPNGQLVVNCAGFGFIIKCYFFFTEFYRVFLWKVLHKTINILDHFCMTMKFYKHEHNSQLSYPDHSKCHNVNFYCNL